MTSDELILFEKEIASLFEKGLIKAPIHLHGGNEDVLIEIFKQIKADDYVFSTHRSHYHALLKGVPPEQVKSEILAGRSISLQFPSYHFFTSAIVGGICSIALGVALAGMAGVKVWCFIGDMAQHTGIFSEYYHYATGHNLPVYFVIEDNGFSVDTPTGKVWHPDASQHKNRFRYYHYERLYPHQGMGKFVIF